MLERLTREKIKEATKPEFNANRFMEKIKEIAHPKPTRMQIENAIYILKRECYCEMFLPVETVDAIEILIDYASQKLQEEEKS